MMPPQLNYTPNSMKQEGFRAFQNSSHNNMRNPENQNPRMMGSSDGYEMIGSGDVRVIEEDGIEGFLKNEGMMEV